MKVLVCGSEGRIMGATIPLLLEAGHDIIGVDTCEKWGQRVEAPVSRDYQFVRTDCSDPDALRPLLKGVEGVIQAAATLFGVTGFHRRAADILGNDLNVHQTVLRLSAESGVRRVVYMSSSMVYETVEVEPYREDATENIIVPRTDYGLSKLVGERLSKAFHRQYNLAYTIWRPFNVIDPSEEGSDDAGVSHVFADMMYRLIRQQQNPLEILGDGDQVRSFVNIKEVAKVLAHYSFDASTENEILNLGRDECVTMRDLALRIHEKACSRGLIKNPRPLQFTSMPVASTDVKRRVGSFEKIARTLGWNSEISLDHSLNECISAYCDRHESTADRVTSVQT